jgi:alkylation response protein AidB-like acyl-CoA dehydrogenase
MPHAYANNEELLRLVEESASLADDVLAKHARDVDARARFPAESVRALAEAGLFGLCVPSALGGLGHGPRAFVACVEELARACASTAMIYVMHVTAAQSIAASQTLGERDAILRAIAQGGHLTTLALSEKGSRSHFWAPVSKLVVAPDGSGFRTNALKSWVTSASHADSYVSSAQRPDAQSPLESTLYLARKGAPGLRVSGAFDGLGLRGNDSAPVSIEDFRVEASALLTELGKGAENMLQVILPWFAVGTAAMANGICRAATDLTAKHLQGASFEHLGGSALRDLPVVRARVAEMSVRAEQARALLGRTLCEMESASPSAPLFVLQTRLASLQAACDVTDLAMKACGGAAFSKHLPIERMFRDARAGWVMAPTVDHLLDFTGKALTGLPLF